MKPPNVEGLLRIWEQGHGIHPIRRALALLDAAADDGGGNWAGAPIGQRDARLLELYEALFGPLLHSVTNCPRCGEVLEMSLATGDLRVSAGAPMPSGPLTLRTRGANIQYRLPNSEDLLDVVARNEDPEAAQVRLLRRCVICVEQAGERQAPDALPAELVDRLAADMATRDPGADLQIGLDCPACGHLWNVCFDIVTYFWSALEDWAQRTLADVHLLACAYGWSEREILGLSATRRQHYVEMVRA